MFKYFSIIIIVLFTNYSYSKSNEDTKKYTFEAGKNEYMKIIGFDSDDSSDLTLLNQYAYFHNNPSVSIGVFDSGFYYKFDDLQNQISKGTNSIGDHGTLVSGIIAAEKDNDIGYTGIVNPKQIYGLNFKDKTIGKERTKYIKDLCPHFDVINISLTLSSLAYRYKKEDYNEELHLKVMDKWRRVFFSKECSDTTFVLSAGNSDVDAKKENGGIHYVKVYSSGEFEYRPLDNVVVVGAIQGDEITQNYGESVDIYAPENVGGPKKVTSSGTSIYSIENYGTSFSAPQVTGTIALIHREIRKNPKRLKEFLLYKANLNNISKVRGKNNPTTSRPILNIYEIVKEVVRVYGPPI